MIDRQDVYDRYAERYERLVAREDYAGNILPALQQIHPLHGTEVVELGAGTGRLTRLLAPLVKHIRACDRSQPALEIAAEKLCAAGLSNWAVAIGDNLALPVAAACADVVIAGWTFGHATVWNADDWPAAVRAAVGEMRRVLRSGGTAAILETMGSGSEIPSPPTGRLAAYYALLENELGFASTWIRTDYRFASLREAEELLRFFFGDAAGERVVERNSVIVPECTGIWWWRKRG